MSYKEIKLSEKFGLVTLFRKLLELNGDDEFALRVTGISGGGGGDVNLTEIGGVAISAGTGVVGSGTLRVTLATNVPLPAAAVTSVTPTPSLFTAGVASGTVLASNASRKTIIITNTHSTNRVTLNFGSTAVLDTGITIMPGSSYNMSDREYFSGQINAIASGATTVLSVCEW